MHAGRFDAHGGARAVAGGPCRSHKRCGSTRGSKMGMQNIPACRRSRTPSRPEKIRVDSRIVGPATRTDLYRRPGGLLSERSERVPSKFCAGPDTVEKRARHQLDLRVDFHTVRNLRLAKKVKQLDSGRSMLLTLRPDGEPMLLVVGRGFYRSVFINVTRAPTEADRDHDAWTDARAARPPPQIPPGRRAVAGEPASSYCGTERATTWDSARVRSSTRSTVAPSTGRRARRRRAGPCPTTTRRTVTRGWDRVGVDGRVGGGERRLRGQRVHALRCMNDFAARVQSMVGKFRRGRSAQGCDAAPAPAPPVTCLLRRARTPGRHRRAPAPAARPKPEACRLADGLPQVAVQVRAARAGDGRPRSTSAPSRSRPSTPANELLVEFWLARIASDGRGAPPGVRGPQRARRRRGQHSPLLDASGDVGKRKAPDAVAAAPGAKRASSPTRAQLLTSSASTRPCWVRRLSYAANPFCDMGARSSAKNDLWFNTFNTASAPWNRLPITTMCWTNSADASWSSMPRIRRSLASSGQPHTCPPRGRPVMREPAREGRRRRQLREELRRSSFDTLSLKRPGVENRLSVTTSIVFCVDWLSAASPLHTLPRRRPPRRIA